VFYCVQAFLSLDCVTVEQTFLNRNILLGIGKNCCRIAVLDCLVQPCSFLSLCSSVSSLYYSSSPSFCCSSSSQLSSFFSLLFLLVRFLCVISVSLLSPILSSQLCQLFPLLLFWLFFFPCSLLLCCIVIDAVRPLNISPM